jgi:hypothetical protein
MQSSLGSRVFLENGPISNVLPGLGLVDQIRIAIICKRTYQITVANNTWIVRFPIDRHCEFPGLKIPSGAFVCKRKSAVIDGIFGEFQGIFCRQTDHPDGYGVFKVADWVHCGEVKDGKFLEGRKVSVNKEAKLLKLTNSRLLADRSVLEKVEIFSSQGVERNILKDGEDIAKVIPRLNRNNDA